MTRFGTRGSSARRARPDAPASSEHAGDRAAAREAALRLLERTRRTRNDLARRLKDKGFASEAIEETLERLAGVGLVDDVEYARAWLAGRWGRRPSGWRLLEQQLRARGISPEDIDTARARLVEEQGAGDDVAAARRLVDQVERRYRSLDPRVRRQRLYSMLMRRGFDGDVIEQVLRPGGEEA